MIELMVKKVWKEWLNGGIWLAVRTGEHWDKMELNDVEWYLSFQVDTEIWSGMSLTCGYLCRDQKPSDAQCSKGTFLFWSFNPMGSAANRHLRKVFAKTMISVTFTKHFHVLERNVGVTFTLDVLILSIGITILPLSTFNHEPYLPVLGSRRIIVTFTMR